MSVYETISNRIIEALQSGVIPWKKRWSADAPRNLETGKKYRGINRLLLQAAPYDSPFWLTFNQARARNGSVKRGERGTPIVFWKVTEGEERQEERERKFLLRYSTVFNVEQTTLSVEELHRKVFDPITECERVLFSYPDPPQVVHGGSRAYYAPPFDLVRMPEKERFDCPESYYSTLFHELTHSTGAAHRLARRGVTDPARFGSHADYAFEELVAELGAAFLSAEAGISLATIGESASYIGCWIKRLRSEPRWIVEASSQAAKAADRIMGGKGVQDEQAENAA